MQTLTKEIWIEVPERREIVSIHAQVENLVAESGVQDGMVLCNAMHITASVFINELIPHIDATYRTIADRSGRGLEGFSQGGRGTMRLGLRYPDLFCSAAAGGGGYESEKRISDSGGYESPSLRFEKGDNAWDLAKAYGGRRTGPNVNWMIYVGTEGFNYENNLDYMRFLKGIGIKCERLVVPGVPHSASGIYAKAGEEIMRFHINNFKHTQSN